jgi:hypothetical protein
MSQSVMAPLETAAKQVGLNQVVGSDSQPSDDRDGGRGGSPNARNLDPSGGDGGASPPHEYDATRAVGVRLADQLTRQGLGTHRVGSEAPRLDSTGEAMYGPPRRRDASLRVQRIMHLTVLASAMRAHGISEPLISRAQLYAEGYLTRSRRGAFRYLHRGFSIRWRPPHAIASGDTGHRSTRQTVSSRACRPSPSSCLAELEP